MTDQNGAGGEREDSLRLSADIVAAFVSNNTVQPQELQGLIQAVHQTMTGLGENAPMQTQPEERKKPAVPVSKSIQQDYLVCLEDGAKLKMLKRYLRARYGLSPEDYRRKWNLPPDYPMVAPAYSVRRSDFAKSIGLGKGVRGERGPAAKPKSRK